MSTSLRGYYGALVLSLLAALAAPTLAAAQTHSYVYSVNVGTTGPVYGFVADHLDGALRAVPGSPYPAFYPGTVAADPLGRFLFVGAVFQGPQPYQNGILAYVIDATTGALTPVTGSPFLLPFANTFVFPAVDSTGRFLYVASYFGIFAFAIGPTGVLTELVGSPFAGPSSVSDLVASQAGALLYALGSFPSELTVYLIDSVSGALQRASTVTTGAYKTLSVAPDDSFVYAINDSAVFGYAVDHAGRLAAIPGLPASLPNRQLMTLQVSSDGRRLYVGSSAGLEQFGIDGSGRLQATGSSLPGAVFDIATDGFGFVYATQDFQLRSTLCVYRVDVLTGTLVPVAQASPAAVFIAVVAPQPPPVPAIAGVLPAKGGNLGEVTVTVLGSRFGDGTSIRLVREGHPDIPATRIGVLGGSYLTAVFDLTGVAPGTYSVVVTNVDGTSAILTAGFTVEPGGAPVIQVDIAGRSVIRSGRPQAMYLAVTNTGNVDGTSAVLWLKVPTHVAVMTRSGQQPTVTLRVGSDHILHYEIVGSWPVGETHFFEFTLTSESRFVLQAGTVR